MSPRIHELRVGRRSVTAGLAWSLLGLSGRLKAQAEVPALAVGAPMQDFGLRNLDVRTGQTGELVWLSDFVGSTSTGGPRKKLLLLNFFASFCAPCRRELPVLSALQTQYSAAGLQVLSVIYRPLSEPVKDSIAKVQEVFASSDPGYPVLLDKYTNRNQLIYMGSRAVLPCNVLIDQNGRIAARHQGQAGDASALQAELEQRFGAARTTSGSP